jgi:uncharacterized repeat protein (TIGR01451 family)
MKTKLLVTLMAAFLLISPIVNFGQAPNLGTTSSFAFFTGAGAFNNDGASVITGDIGSYSSSPVGFPPGTVIGNIFIKGNPALESPFFDVATAFSNFTAGGDPLTTILENQNGTGFIYPGTYSTVGASALNSNFTLDAKGDPNAIFVINIKGRLDVASLANIYLINSASECNVYWQIDGAFELGAGAHFVGTVIANGAISLLEGSSLLGRGLSTAGAIELHNNEVTLPCLAIEELTIDKVADKSSVSSAEETINYIITIVNTGNVNLTGVVLTDVFAAGAILDSGDDANAGVLDVGETWIYTADYVVNQDDIDTGTALVNSASVVTDQTGVQQDDATTTIHNASLTIEKVADKSGVSSAGETIIYTITVVNTGDVNLTGVVLTDVFAGGAVLDSGDDTNIGVLDVGETWIYKADYVVTQDDIDAGTALVNSVSVNTGQTSVQQAKATTTILNASLTIEKVADKSSVSAAGELITYTITVVNTGNAKLTGVMVEDKLTKGTIVTDLPVNLYSGDLNGDNVLDVGETWIYKAYYTVTQTDINYANPVKSGAMLKHAYIIKYINTATVKTNQTKAVSDNADTNILQDVSLTINKVADKVAVSKAGEVINYSITVGNTGNVSITGVLVEDKLSKGTIQTDLAVNLFGGDLDGDNVLDVGERWIYKTSYTVTQSDIDYFSSTKSVSLLKCAVILEIVNVATVVTDQLKSQSDDARTIVGTSVLGHTETFSVASSSTVRRAMPVTFTEAGQIQSISVYHNAGSGNVILGVYSDEAGFPSALLGVTPSTAVRTTAGWQTVSLTTPLTVTSGQKVWLVWVFQNVSNIRYERTSTPASVSSTSAWSSGIPPTFGKSYNGNFKFSVYCTYTPNAVIPTKIGNKEVFGLASSSTVRRAMPVTFNEAGQIQSISVYHNAGSGNVLLGVYSDAGGKPSALLGVTPSSAVRTTAGWQTVTLTTPVSVTSGQKVWLAWVFQNPPYTRFVSTSTPASVSTGGSGWSSGMPSVFGKSYNGNFKFSVYCTYIADNSKSAVIAGEIEPVFEKAGFKVYPNPFSEKLRFEFVSPESVNARIDLYDMTGRLVKTIFEQPIEGGVNYEADFRPETIISGMYIYRMTMGDAVYNGKVVFKKE